MRVILYTGKGGVGKSSVAAATAVKVAESGKRVLIMSTDQAHSLGDSFEREIGNHPVRIMDNLDALEIDAVAESEHAWGDIQGYLKQLVTLKSEQNIETEELMVFPGLEELFSLLKMLSIYEQGEYDMLIVDCAPSGETFSLLKFPELLGNFIESVLPAKRKVLKVAGPLMEKLTKIPMPGDNVFLAIERLIGRLRKLQQLMLDRESLSIRLVTTPEKVVIKETKRTFTCLHLYSYNVDAVIINKIYPMEAMEGYFNKWIMLQHAGMAEIEESFGDILLFKLNLQKHELTSLPLLREASKLYQDCDPAAVLCQNQIFSFEKEGESFIMSFNLPFAEKEEMELLQKGEDIVIAVKNERRTYMLPDAVKGKKIKKAKFEEGSLNIEF
jgi:arsenite-transporting ATPase